MDWLQFGASVIHSVAWPIATIVLGLIYRKPLAALIPLLRHARYKGLEFDFGREVAALGQDTSQLKVSLAIAPARIEAPAAPPTPSDKTLALLDEAESLSGTFPEPAVLVAWQAVETELRDAAEREGIAEQELRRGSLMLLISELAKRKVLTPQSVEFLNRMRNLRNVAAHHNGVQVTSDDAREFTAIARDVVGALRAIAPANR